MVGAMPRKEGMERKDLLAANVKIFKVQGQALDQHAKKSVKVLVVGNPANTNAVIMSHYAPSIPKENFTAMTRLDQNRASAQLAQKAGVGVEKVKGCIIWGNHSSTQFPDASHATIDGQPTSEVSLYIASCVFGQVEELFHLCTLVLLHNLTYFLFGFRLFVMRTGLRMFLFRLFRNEGELS